MPIDPLSAVSLGISGASALANIFRGGPELPFGEDEINELFDAQLARELAQTESDVGRRLSAQGLSGSGVIDQVVRDARTRVQQGVEERRRKALLDFGRLSFGAELEGSRQQGANLQGLTGLGFNVAALSGAFDQQQDQMQDPFRNFLIKSGITTNQDPTAGNPVGQIGSAQSEGLTGFSFDF